MHIFLSTLDFSLPLRSPVLVFSILLFIILLSPILLRRLRLPGIMGLILAGVAIGPNGFNILERNSAIELFSTIGLIYIMYLAGLELDLNLFKKNRYKSLLFGLFTFALPLGIGLPICYYFLEYSWLASLMIASMFATHTLVAYPVASRLGISKNEAVAITVGGTIITDTAVLLILAVITGSQEGGLSPAFWIRFVVSLALFGFILFVVFPPVARWFFKNIEGEKTSQFIFVLAMVFLAAFLAELAGVEAIIGAFMAGLTLNSLIPHTSSLMNRIEFVGNALFIPLFLIGVGMLVDIKVLTKGPEALLVAGTLSVVALIGKWVAAWLTQIVFGYSASQRQVIFGLSSAHAAATLAVILVGYRIELLDENILNGTIILILITCLVASYVTEKSGRRLAITAHKKTPELPEMEEKLLVPIANPATIEPLMDFAILLKDRKSKQPIIALSIVKDDDEAREKVIQNRQMLEKAIVHAAATDTGVITDTRVSLKPSNGISQYIKEKMVTSVVMGWSSKQQSVEGKIFGTTLDYLIQDSPQTIWVLRLLKPLNITRRIILLVPYNAHYEVGFLQWLKKVYQFAHETSTKVALYSDMPTKEVIVKYWKEYLKSSIEINFHLFTEWQDFNTTFKQVNIDDFFILISARKNTISYNPYLDDIPSKLPKCFKDNNFAVVYPEQSDSDMLDNVITEEDLTLSTIGDNIERLSRWSKLIWKRNKNKKA